MSEEFNGLIWFLLEVSALETLYTCSLLIKWPGDDLKFEHKSFELSTGSDASLETAAQWLENCVQHHERCRARIKTGWHPKRLLDVGLKTGCDIHLLESPELGSEEKYFTLSHCWGKTSNVALMTANLESFKQRVPLESLSKTFLDTIYVSRFFGIRYLWIDSLCLYLDRSQEKDLGHLRLGPLFSEGFLLC